VAWFGAGDRKLDLDNSALVRLESAVHTQKRLLARQMVTQQPPAALRLSAVPAGNYKSPASAIAIWFR